MDVTIVVTPKRRRTWDETAMLAAMVEHGYTADDAARLPVDMSPAREKARGAPRAQRRRRLPGAREEQTDG